MFGSNAAGLPEVYVPSFEVRVAGSPLPEPIARRITRVSVTEPQDPPNHFSLQFYDPGLELIGTVDGLFAEGAKVEIGLGYVGDVRPMFKGRITAVTAQFPESGPPVVDVEGSDDLHKLTRGTAYGSFEEADGDIVRKMIADQMVGLQVEVDDTPARMRPRVQMHRSNYAFLQDLAALNRYAVWVEDGTLFFKKTRPTRNKLPLEWGRTLQSFTPRISTAGLVRKVVVKGYDPIQKGFTGAADSPATLPVGLSPSGLLDVESGSGGRSELVLEGAPVSSEVEATAYAQAILDQIWQGAVTGSGTSPGQPEIRVGTVLEMSKIGRFSGDYVVTSVTHSVGEGGYQTSFEVNGGTSFTGRDPATAGAGGLAGSGVAGRAAGGGVMVGIVQENKDPEGLGRVRVRLPGVSDEPIVHWARVAVPMAGAERGIYFLPEREDEVLVAFEHGDPARPYVLGALWNGRDKPPKPNADGENNLRLIKTRSGHVLRFDDKGGAEKIELIDASGKSSLVIDTSAATVTITSAKDVVITAQNGTIRLEAQKIEVASTGATKVNADGGLNLESSGTTVLKGSTVNIN
jgi:phage protein D/phage baseplate assembly protein gpV